MNKSMRRVAGLALASGLALAACTASASSAPGSAAGGAGGGGVAVSSTVSGTLGVILTGPNGRTLYVFAKDVPNQTNCTANCAQTWPPLTVASGQQPQAGAGVTGQLGTFARPDGTTQVSYNAQPLYYFSGDAAAGDTKGQGVGGVWSAAKASGSAPAGSAAASAAPGAASPAPASGGYHY